VQEEAPAVAPVHETKSRGMRGLGGLWHFVYFTWCWFCSSEGNYL